MAATAEIPAALLSPETIGYRLEGTGIAFIVMLTVFVALRYISRYMNRTRTGVDDFLMPLAWLFNVGLCACSISMVKDGGVGHHLAYLSTFQPLRLVTFIKIQIPFTILYALAVNFPKLTILGLYLRIFVERPFRIATYILLALVGLSCFSVVLVTCLQCMPLAFMWDPLNHPGGYCIDINSFWRWGSFPNIVTDVFMMILPLPCIYKLQLSKKDKIGLFITFATGSVGLITSIIRFTLFFQTDGQADSTWTAVKLGQMSICEAGVYLIAACLPTYRPFFNKIRDRAGLSTRGGSRMTTLKKDTAGSGGGSIHLSTVQSKHGFARMDDESKLVQGTTEELSDKEGSMHSGEDKFRNGQAIRIKHDYSVTESHR